MQISEVTLLMVAFVLGGTLSQWPLGWASDKIDRRIVIAATSIGTVGTGLVLAFWALSGFYPVFAVAVLHGALMVPLYALCLSHVNDQVTNDRLVEVSGGLLLVYSVGATIGPTVAAVFMEGDRPGGLFVFIACVLGLLGLAVLIRMQTTPRKVVERVDFVPVPKTSPSVYSLEEDD